MNIDLFKELSLKSDNVLRKEFEAGEYSLMNFKEMISCGYITQDRYNRITRSYNNI